jgi:hypothetical protein
MRQSRLNRNSLQLRLEVTSSIHPRHAASPILFAHPVPSATTIGEVTDSRLSSATKQEDEEIPMKELSQPPSIQSSSETLEETLQKEIC